MTMATQRFSRRSPRLIALFVGSPLLVLIVGLVLWTVGDKEGRSWVVASMVGGSLAVILGRLCHSESDLGTLTVDGQGVRCAGWWSRCGRGRAVAWQDVARVEQQSLPTGQLLLFWRHDGRVLRIEPARFGDPASIVAAVRRHVAVVEIEGGA